MFALLRHPLDRAIRRCSYEAGRQLGLLAQPRHRIRMLHQEVQGGRHGEGRGLVAADVQVVDEVDDLAVGEWARTVLRIVLLVVPQALVRLRWNWLSVRALGNSSAWRRTYITSS